MQACAHRRFDAHVTAKVRRPANRLGGSAMLFVMDVPLCLDPVCKSDASHQHLSRSRCSGTIIQNAIDLYTHAGFRSGKSPRVVNAVGQCNRRSKPSLADPSVHRASALCKMADRGAGSLARARRTRLHFDNVHRVDGGRIKGIKSARCRPGTDTTRPDLECGNRPGEEISPTLAKAYGVRES